MAIETDIFSVPIFFIVLRETIEAAVIVSVLLAFIRSISRSPVAQPSSARTSASSIPPLLPGDAASAAAAPETDVESNSSGLENSPVLPGVSLKKSDSYAEPELLIDPRRLARLVWLGTVSGLLASFAVGAVFLVLWYRYAVDLWAKAELLWEGIFSLVAAVLVAATALAMLRGSRLYAKYERKLAARLAKLQPSVVTQADAAVDDTVCATSSRQKRQPMPIAKHVPVIVSSLPTPPSSSAPAAASSFMATHAAPVGSGSSDVDDRIESTSLSRCYLNEHANAVTQSKDTLYMSPEPPTTTRHSAAIAAATTTTTSAADLIETADAAAASQPLHLGNASTCARVNLPPSVGSSTANADASTDTGLLPYMSTPLNSSGIQDITAIIAHSKGASLTDTTPNIDINSDDLDDQDYYDGTSTAPVEVGEHSMKQFSQAFFWLPFVTVLREGLEGVVFIGGVSLNSPPTSIPLAAVTGICGGAAVGVFIHLCGSSLALHWFFVVSSCMLLILADGLLSRAVGNFEDYTWSNAIGLMADDVGTGAFDPRRIVWHLDCCSPEDKTQVGWSIFNALLGWRNNATISTVTVYCMYWVVIIGVLVFMRFRETRQHAWYHRQRDCRGWRSMFV